MQGIRRPDTRSNINALATGFVAFVLVFVFETLLNLKFKTTFKFADDIKQLYYGARLDGKDWSNLLHPPYFSAIPSIIYYSIFHFVVVYFFEVVWLIVVLVLFVRFVGLCVGVIVSFVLSAKDLNPCNSNFFKYIVFPFCV